MIEFKQEELSVQVYASSEEMSIAAAQDVADSIRQLSTQHNEINIVFSGALSQEEFHKALAKEPGLPWERINAFSVDEFWCPEMDKSNTVGMQPTRDLYEAVHPKSVNFIQHDAADPEMERTRYEQLLQRHVPHIACLGIGRSGHIALNEPGQTDFNDPCAVRIVGVPEESKAQLMEDPNFQKQGFIPDKGILVMIVCWKEFFLPLILTSTPQAKPLSVVAGQFITEHGINWGQMSAFSMLILNSDKAVVIFAVFSSRRRVVVLAGRKPACVLRLAAQIKSSQILPTHLSEFSITFLPVLIIAVFAQRYLISGLTLGAVKG